MKPIRFDILPAPEILKNDVECFWMSQHTSEDGLAIKTSPNGVPGIVFQHDNGRSVIESITTRLGTASSIPTLFLYGPGMEPSVMKYKKGSYTTLQVILKPHALKTLLGINASALANGFAELNEFSTGDLNLRLMETVSEQECLALLTNFLSARLEQTKTRDSLVEESLRFIHKNIVSINVKRLLEHLNISERQFEKRFSQTVGISPQSYIRVKRFNEAIKLIKAGQYERLTDIAHALNFHDQSHFIRDIKAFSGITPRRLSQKADDFYHNQAGLSYV